MDTRVVRAGELYDQAVFVGGDGVLTEAADQLDAAEADLVLARGKLLHGRYLETQVEDPAELTHFERAADLYRKLGDEVGEGRALFWIGCFHQVVKGDDEAALTALARSHDLAIRTGDELTLSYVLRHQGVAAHSAGSLDQARNLLERSTNLRRTLGFAAGAAANLVGLIYLAKAQDRPEDVPALVAEATTLAEQAGATRILDQIGQAAGELAQPGGSGLSSE
ncbi:hypothetical protein FB561_5627 [Kribbella amoyensis]|uniref:Tetratricopeptide repeat protein n=1 Tax=Kribbella amoyensis TaxID=996641 RepID=A0A561C011_9ACTN|nr:tetratricopeptide repeat protein [Kribbella amoyensis]TWD84440.1 hypothetical protein FB561_5627 [Kribbella amoyensis]